MALHYTHYDVIVKTHVMRGDVKAFQYYADMKKHFSLSSGTCVGLINLCVDSKFVQFAEMVFKDRREIGVANLALYSSLIKLYSAMRKYDSVCELYPLMLEDGLELDEQMQAMLMTSAVKASRQDLVDQLHQASHLPGKDELYYMSNLRTCRQDRDVGRALRSSIAVHLTRRELVGRIRTNLDSSFAAVSTPFFAEQGLVESDCLQLQNLNG